VCGGNARMLLCPLATPQRMRLCAAHMAWLLLLLLGSGVAIAQARPVSMNTPLADDEAADALDSLADAWPGECDCAAVRGGVGRGWLVAGRLVPPSGCCCSCAHKPPLLLLLLLLLHAQCHSHHVRMLLTAPRPCNAATACTPHHAEVLPAGGETAAATAALPTTPVTTVGAGAAAANGSAAAAAQQAPTATVTAADVPARAGPLLAAAPHTTTTAMSTATTATTAATATTTTAMPAAPAPAPAPGGGRQLRATQEWIDCERACYCATGYRATCGSRRGMCCCRGWLGCFAVDAWRSHERRWDMC
jgi:hypothetical protein